MERKVEMSYIMTKKKKPCYICGSLTRRLDYCYETYICSQACKDVMDKRYSDYLKSNLLDVK